MERDFAMPMTLKRDLRRAARNDGTAKPIDLVHLSTQTMGDRALEAEVLGMFLDHSGAYVAKLRNASQPADRKLAAHTLKGAARAIGAWELAELAQDAEAAGFRDDAALEREVARVCAYARELR